MSPSLLKVFLWCLYCSSGLSQPKLSFTLSRPGFDVDPSKSVIITLTTDMSVNIGSTVKRICDAYGIDKFYTDSTRCRTLYTISVSSQRIQWINQYLSTMSDQISINTTTLSTDSLQQKNKSDEAKLFMLSSVLNSNLLTQQNKQTICYIGDISWSLLSFYLISLKTYNIIIITKDLQTTLDSMIFLKTFKSKEFKDRNIIFMTETDFIAFSHINVCAIIHLGTDYSNYQHMDLYMINHFSSSFTTSATTTTTDTTDTAVYSSFYPSPIIIDDHLVPLSITNFYQYDSYSTTTIITPITPIITDTATTTTTISSTHINTNINTNTTSSSSILSLCTRIGTSVMPSTNTLLHLIDSQGFTNINYDTSIYSPDSLEIMNIRLLNIHKHISQSHTISTPTTNVTTNTPTTAPIITTTTSASKKYMTITTSNIENTMKNDVHLGSCTTTSSPHPPPPAPFHLHIVLTYTSRLFQDNVQGIKEMIETAMMAMMMIDHSSHNHHNHHYSSTVWEQLYQETPIRITVEIGGMSPYTDIVIDLLDKDKQRDDSNSSSSSNSSTHCNTNDNTNPIAGNQLNGTYVLQIVYGCHSPTILLKNYICYQTEQPWSYILNPNYSKHSYVSSTVLHNALAVYVMSSLHKEKLNTLGIHHSFVIPFYSPKKLWNYTTHSYISYPNNTLGNTALTASIQRPQEYTYDVLAYGACTTKRLQLHRELQRYKLSINQTLKLHSICISEWKQAIFDIELDHKIIHSKVIVNPHSYDNSSLQTHRILHLLSYGKCVINERSTIDSELDSMYASAVIFAQDNEDMIHKLHEVLHNNTMRVQCEENSIALYNAIHSNYDEIINSLRHIIPKLKN